MEDKGQEKSDGAPVAAPRPKRSSLVRIVRALRRRRHRPQSGGDKEHAENERTMATWTRRVGVFTVVLAICAIANVVIITLQLGEMHSGGIDTHDLATATRNLVITASGQEIAESAAASAAGQEAANMKSLAEAGRNEAGAMEKLRAAGEDQATATGNLLQATKDAARASQRQAVALDKLRAAGESQAAATENLAEAGRAQAAATRDLATNSANQLTAIQAGADAAKAQAEATRQSADAALKAADANIRAADAQRRMADLESSANKSAVALKILMVNGLDSNPDKSNKVKISVTPSFGNVGNTWISSRINYFVFFLGDQLPAVPNYSSAVPIGGNELISRPGETWSGISPIDYMVDAKEAKKNIFIFGYLEYTDATNTPQKFCYAYQVAVFPGKPVAFWAVGGPAYHCQN